MTDCFFISQWSFFIEGGGGMISLTQTRQSASRFLEQLAEGHLFLTYQLGLPVARPSSFRSPEQHGGQQKRESEVRRNFKNVARERRFLLHNNFSVCLKYLGGF